MGIWWDRMGYQKHDASLFENRACTKSIAVSSYHLRVKIAMLGDFGGISPMFGQTHVLKERKGVPARNPSSGNQGSASCRDTDTFEPTVSADCPRFVPSPDHVRLYENEL